jgi:hypothetical protein
MFRLLLTTAILIVQPHHVCALVCCGTTSSPNKRSSNPCCRTIKCDPRAIQDAASLRCTPSSGRCHTAATTPAKRPCTSVERPYCRPVISRSCCSAPARYDARATVGHEPKVKTAARCALSDKTDIGFPGKDSEGCDRCCFECEFGRPLLLTKGDSPDRALDMGAQAYFVGVPQLLHSSYPADAPIGPGGTDFRSHSQRHAWLSVWLK